ncbi:MAG: hypothetical protein LLG97_00880 [Deltaproteobacteria bacterium]|nr:hypothetical protein [Deltaproteobacteria bacterium]
MKRLTRTVALSMILAAGVMVLVWPLAYEKYRELVKPDPYQLVFTDGKRSWSLDTGALKLKTEEGTGIRYLEVYARITYTFTEFYDINHYWMQTASRQWQPITATGCNKEGDILES